MLRFLKRASYVGAVLSFDAVVISAILVSHKHGPASIAGGAFACFVVDCFAAKFAEELGL